jgi:hypothetical protein
VHHNQTWYKYSRFVLYITVKHNSLCLLFFFLFLCLFCSGKIIKHYLYVKKGERKSIQKFKERENTQMTIFKLQKILIFVSIDSSSWKKFNECDFCYNHAEKKLIKVHYFFFHLINFLEWLEGVLELGTSLWHFMWDCFRCFQVKTIRKMNFRIQILKHWFFFS